MTKLNKVLCYIIVSLLVIILIGTIIGLAGMKTKKDPEILIQQGKAINLAEPKNTEVVSYFDLGRIRISTLPEDSKTEKIGSVLVLNPWVEYPQGDTVFYEEIARKQNVIKGVFTDYFSTRTKSELLSQSELVIEESIKTQINSKLSLGQISDIYFTDYLYLD